MITTPKPRPVKAIDVEAESNKIERRRIIDHLPGVLITPLIKKILSGFR